MRMRVWLAGLLALMVATSARAAPALEAYGRMPAVDRVSLSPSGDRFALVAREADGRRLYVRSRDGQTELQAPLGESRVRNIVWAGDDYLIAFLGGAAKAPINGIPLQEFTGAAVINMKTHTFYGVFNKSDVYVDAIFGWFGAAKVDGRWEGYIGAIPYQKLRQGNSSGHTFPDLYRLDLETGKPRLIVAGGDQPRRWVFDASGEIVGHSTTDQRGAKTTLFAGRGEGAPLLSRAAGQGEMELVGQGRTAGALMFVERTSEGQAAREVRPGGPPEGEVLHSGVDAEHALTDRDTGLLIGVAEDDGSGLQLYDPTLQRRFEAARRALKAPSTNLVSYSRGFDRMVVYTEGPKDSGTYWLADMAKKSVSPIGWARPDIAEADIAPSRMFAYKAADGLALDGVLTLPVGRQPKSLPLVVLPHGGPLVNGDQPGFDWLPQAFASRGYAVFQPNYRGTLGYGEAFRRAAFGEMGRKMQTDISDGVAALAAEGLVDPKRVSIVGASYGGYAALAGVTVQHGLYRSAVSVAGPADLKTLISWVRERRGPDRRAVNFWKSLAGAADGQDLDLVSPRRLAQTADAPILLIHGENDTVVPIEQSRMMERALRIAHKPVEFLALQGEDHWLSNEATRLAMLNSAVAFVEKNNPPN